MSKASQRRLAEKQKRLRAGGGNKREREIHALMTEARQLGSDAACWRALGRLFEKPQPHADDGLTLALLEAVKPAAMQLLGMQNELLGLDGELESAYVVPGILVAGMGPKSLWYARPMSFYGKASMKTVKDVLEWLTSGLNGLPCGVWIFGLRGLREMQVACVAITSEGGSMARIHLGKDMIALASAEAALQEAVHLIQLEVEDEDFDLNPESAAIFDAVARLESLHTEESQSGDDLRRTLAETVRGALDLGQLPLVVGLWHLAAGAARDAESRRKLAELVDELDSARLAAKVSSNELERLQAALDLARAREAAVARELAATRRVATEDAAPVTVRSSLAERLAVLI